MNSNTESKYSVVDLFAGAGGLSYGFLQTGRFSIKAAFENSQNAQKTYKRNHGNTAVYNDVAEALGDDVKVKLGKVDVVIGGPPCQGFSNVNRQKNHAISQNNSLVKKFVQVVLHLNPKAFVMENVSMLQSDIHRFYVDETDAETIKKYSIKTTPSEIRLLESEFIFPGIADIAKNMARISSYLWKENDYLSLNVVFKTLNNPKKLCASLETHKKRLLALANNLIAAFDENDSILKHSYDAGVAIQSYFTVSATYEAAERVCRAIMPAIMLQRMLSKAKEILDNRIVVDHYSTEDGLVAHVTSMAVIDYIESILGATSTRYCINYGVLPAVSFGAPQKRMRFVLIGVKKSICADVKLPTGTFTEANYRTVKDAIKDLEEIETATEVSDGDQGIQVPDALKDISELGKQLRDSKNLCNHVSTATTPDALKRFMAIKQGENFHSLPPELKTTYSDTERTQNTIYLRLKYDEPSGTVVNVRKSMWIHPVKHRALSIREAARLQTFPDSFVFCGTKDSQYQQVGNAVPPILAKAIAEHLCGYLDCESK
ncbi:DNA cytosine methyltransferase [Desulfosporosinus metallidurans]|uniref:DNA (cytosine-5-)-methyltransferase n=1 Tax=Desulfosporosinus metallidurans TaxID=1888891 RepID=A0A1Q8QH52_9FIRM|nr:DNA cytosine methyltransferase [Desulfosporosinus metallidurans]OLN26664.1 DNA-cytosine methyltransferase [Desulfosporosinus metallidurans]